MANAKIGKKFTKGKAEQFRKALLAWYDRHGRILPWRYKGKQKPDPYRVWLSEIMLQQTTVAAVGPYFEKFTQTWPTIQSLAKAKNDDVMNAWAGLGYYSRARNLHKCAQIVANEFGGKFPSDQAALKKLPGIGDYTSAAIMTLVFNKPATVVDGNVERVMARYFAWEEPMPVAKKDLKTLAAGLFDNFTDRPGDLAQALMDLGATVCTPKSPKCGSCPVAAGCEARKRGIAVELPRQTKQKAKPQKFGHVFWITNGKGQVLLHRRPAKGLLGGMAALPTSDWILKGNPDYPAILKNLKPANFGGAVKHGFTHFDLELTLKTGNLKTVKLEEGYFWVNRAEIAETGFPTVFKKAVKLFMQDTASG